MWVWRLCVCVVWWCSDETAEKQKISCAKKKQILFNLLNKSNEDALNVVDIIYPLSLICNGQRYYYFCSMRWRRSQRSGTIGGDIVYGGDRRRIYESRAMCCALLYVIAYLVNFRGIFFWFVYSLIRCCWFFVLTVDSVRSFWSVKRIFFSFWCSPAIHITRARDACHSSSLSLSFSTGVIFVLFVSSTARTRRMKNGNRIFGKRYYAHHFYWAQNYGVWQYLVLFSFLCVLLSIPFI